MPKQTTSSASALIFLGRVKVNMKTVKHFYMKPLILDALFVFGLESLTWYFSAFFKWNSQIMITSDQFLSNNFKAIIKLCACFYVKYICFLLWLLCGQIPKYRVNVLLWITCYVDTMHCDRDCSTAFDSECVVFFVRARRYQESWLVVTSALFNLLIN